MRSDPLVSVVFGAGARLGAGDGLIRLGGTRAGARTARWVGRLVLAGLVSTSFAISVVSAAAQDTPAVKGGGRADRPSARASDDRPAESDVAPALVTEPWFTGPLIAPGATTLDAGQISLQPFLSGGTALATGGAHGRFEPDTDTTASVAFELDVSVGLTDRFTLIVSPAGAVGFIDQGQSFAGLGDLPVELQAQLWRGRHEGLVPDLLLHVEESFPTGAYQHLDSGAEGIGTGSFITTMGLTGGWLWHLDDAHWLHLLGDLSGAVGSEVEVSGVNTYGGDPATRGRVDPGSWVQLELGAEYSLTRNWALALDVEMAWEGASTFRPGPVGSGAGVPQTATGLPASSYLGLAPALEYMVNADFGFISGVWLGVAGHNTPTFAIGVISTVWTF